MTSAESPSRCCHSGEIERCSDAMFGDGRLCARVCHFSRPGADSGGSVSTEQGRIVSKMAEFAYELCHTKRRINADELARIT